MAIKPWEPYFRASEDNLTSVAVWVRFLELPIEFYDMEVLKEIGSVIGPVLRIDSYIATRSRGSYARLCIQIELDKPLINSIKIGRLVQQVKYEGILSLCFCCGRLGHKQENCWYQIKEKDRSDSDTEKSLNQASEEEKQLDPNFGPWMLVTRKKNSVRNGRSGSLLRNEHKGEVNQKGIFVRGKENTEGALVKSNKRQVLSNLPDQARVVSDVSAQGETQNGDMRNLVVSFSATSPKQSAEVMRTDGKYHHGSSSTITRGSRSIGAKRSKSLKRQHPSSS